MNDYFSNDILNQLMLPRYYNWEVASYFKPRLLENSLQFLNIFLVWNHTLWLHFSSNNCLTSVTHFGLVDWLH